jgi:hypothetical protein
MNRETGKVWDWIGHHDGICSVDIALATSVELSLVETVIRKWEAIVAYSQVEGCDGVVGVTNACGMDYVIHFGNGCAKFSSCIVNDINATDRFDPPVEALEVIFVMRVLQT